jgi:hypothetical protein
MSTEILTLHPSLSSSSPIAETSMTIVSDSLLDLISLYASVNIAHIISGVIQKTTTTSESMMEITFTKKGKQVLTVVRAFFDTLKRNAKTTFTEMIHIFFLLSKYMAKEEKDCKDGKSRTISESNLGSLLLCGVIIGLKMDRDIPFKNDWFVKEFKVKINDLNESELSFLKKIEFKCVFPQESYFKFENYFLKYQIHFSFDSSSFVFTLPLLS